MQKKIPPNLVTLATTFFVVLSVALTGCTSPSESPTATESIAEPSETPSERATTPSAEPSEAPTTTESVATAPLENPSDVVAGVSGEIRSRLHEKGDLSVTVPPINDFERADKFFGQHIVVLLTPIQVEQYQEDGGQLGYVTSHVAKALLSGGKQYLAVRFIEQSEKLARYLEEKENITLPEDFYTYEVQVE